MLGTAIKIASTLFENKRDKAGQPYIMHCLAVMYALNSDDEELNCIAVLHDVPEDDPRGSEIVLKELRDVYGFSARVVKALRLLTHDLNDTYNDYIKAISCNEDATKVKKADLRHNSDITRLKELTTKDLERIEKYFISFIYLSKIS